MYPDMTFSLFLEGPDAYIGQKSLEMQQLTCKANGSLHSVPKETMIRPQVAKLINFLAS